VELNSFSTRVPGKWVLAGEHAVLRGKNAIAIPHPEFSLELSFSPGHRSDQLICRDLPDVLLEVILHRLNLKSAPVGSLSITSSIPQSSGLGSSAALSVAFVKWAARLEGWPEASWFEKARSLEDHFHGRSSGMVRSNIA
jgi:mevalonate kinase